MTPLDLFASLAVLFGTPLAVVTTIVAIFAIADWLRFGRGAIRLSSAVVNHIGDRARAQAPAPKPVQVVFKVFFVAAPQAAWVVALYLMARWSIVAFYTVGGQMLDWESRFLFVLSPPAEEPPWTVYVAVVAFGSVIALDAALAIRNTLAANVATFVIMASRFVGGVVAGICGVIGGFILAALIIITFFVGLGGGEPEDMVPFLSGAFTVVILAGFGFLTIFLGGAAVTGASRTLFPGFTVPDWFDEDKA